MAIKSARQSASPADSPWISQGSRAGFRKRPSEEGSMRNSSDSAGDDHQCRDERRNRHEDFDEDGMSHPPVSFKGSQRELGRWRTTIDAQEGPRANPLRPLS